MNVLTILALTLALSLFAPGSVRGADTFSRALSDLEVLYVYEYPESIDWPTLFYLNDVYGAEIHLMTVATGDGFYYSETYNDRGDIRLRKYTVGQDHPALVDSVLAYEFTPRESDIVLIAETINSPLLNNIVRALPQRPADVSRFFSVQRIYRLVPPERGGSADGHVVMNRTGLLEEYRDNMKLEVPQFFTWWTDGELTQEGLVHYNLTYQRHGLNAPVSDFVSGINKLRLSDIVRDRLPDGALQQGLLATAKNYVSMFRIASSQTGVDRVNNAIAGYQALQTFSEQVASASEINRLTDFPAYFADLMERARVAVLKEVGLNWDGRIVIRETPHGSKLKFRASLTVNGPKPVELAHTYYYPYWTTERTVVDSVSRVVQPHQTFIREYLIDIDESRLEAQMPESLMFATQLIYGNTPINLNTALPIWETPDLKVEFEPPFIFVHPVERLNVDKVVSALNWKVRITKPRYYHGTVDLNLSTPRGVFAGAYRQKINLESGRTSETVRIPFSISNLFELGVHHPTVTLSVDGRQAVADTGAMRIASCEIKETVTVGFMPDSTGLLEDILRMTDCRYRPLTDRSLKTADLDAYDVIVIGSGALRSFPSFEESRDRLDEYLRYGGSLVVFGQPREWPDGILPVSLVTSTEVVSADQLLNRIPEAKILAESYKISESVLLSYLKQPREVTAAVMSPSERVFVTPTGATLLAVSRMGEGQIIYCGLPLIEMISELNIEAIHLFANLMNY